MMHNSPLLPYDRPVPTTKPSFTDSDHPRHRWLYPIDWRELSLSIQFRRANGQ